MRSHALLIAAAFLTASTFAADGTTALQDEERARIATHGPWPMPARADPSNRVSGLPQAVALGERLFSSPSLSGTGSLSCATCHAPWRRFTDGRPRAFGVEIGSRNTLSVLNVAHYRAFGWEGVQPVLWAQSVRPLLDEREMKSSATHVADVMRRDPRLVTLYQAAFGAPLPRDDQALLVDVGKALAAFQETLASGRTPFDEFRDALVHGDGEALAHYPAQAQRGLRLFVGKARCASCHSGPMFSDGGPHVSRIASVRQDDRTELGRARGTFRTPGLREVAATGPYMHDGSVANLCDTLRPHAGAHASGPVLSARERQDLVEFLRTLSVDTDPPFTNPMTLRCRR